MYFRKTGKVTPATIELTEPGTYELLFRKKGYEDKVVTVTVDEGETKSVSVTLTKKAIGYAPLKEKPKPGIGYKLAIKKEKPPTAKSYIKCTSTPPGAEIWIRKKG